MTTPNLTDTLVEDEVREDEAPAARAWVLGIGSPEDNFEHAGRILALEAGAEVRFGRDDGSAEAGTAQASGGLRVGIPYGWVSGEHAHLQVVGEPNGLRFVLEDLGSRNGTLVGGERITAPTSLRPGEVFEIGRSFWSVREVRMRRARTHKLSELDPTGTCSPHLHHIHRTLLRLASSSIPILLRGETGTGKEYLARAIHRVSGRTGPFLSANLAAMSEDRVEALLFGGRGHEGLFEQANNGTLLLDELGELSPPVQAKLLSALTEGRAARVDEEDARNFDVRLVASTLHDLSRMVDQGSFRPDLYSRLAGFVAELPPVRARKEDLGLLCRSFVRKMQGEGRPTEITTNAFRRILARAWPFNVRQLNQTLATAALLAGADGTITADALAEILDQDDGLPQNPDEVRRLRAELVGHLSKHEGDTHEVARAMGRDIYQIKRWLERFALQAENYRI
jgi:DNA-binding NtrC family response regulator